MLPELREAEAPPEIAALYEDMRRTMRLPLVNLIYRHLATMPGVLPFVWRLVRPAMASGVLDAAHARVLAGTPPLALAQLDGAPLEAGAFGKERCAALAVVRSYNRGNGLNLVALSAVRLALEHPDAIPVRPAPPPGPPPDPAPRIPPIPALGDLAPDIAETVRGLAGLHGGGAGVIPSLYLHLAHWPAVLGAVAARLQPTLADGSVERGREAAVALAQAEARRLVPALAASEAPPREHLAAVASVLDRFTQRVIPEMIPVGLALERLL
jgi:hypothetical protein